MEQQQASKKENERTTSMTTNSELLARRNEAVARGVANMHNIYAERAENAEVWDVEGKRYIDFAGGIGVLNTGHRHPKVMAAVKEQLERYTHTCFQVLPYEPYVELAERLNQLSPISGPSKTLFLTTGSEAVDRQLSPSMVVITGAP
jgi:4-aminobutyrate aminotransferase/(S)-3-amino-2-methylpropionate transaminase